MNYVSCSSDVWKFMLITPENRDGNMVKKVWQTDGRTDGQTDGRTDRQTDGRTEPVNIHAWILRMISQHWFRNHIMAWCCLVTSHHYFILIQCWSYEYWANISCSKYPMTHYEANALFAVEMCFLTWIKHESIYCAMHKGNLSSANHI